MYYDFAVNLLFFGYRFCCLDLIRGAEGLAGDEGIFSSITFALRSMWPRTSRVNSVVFV